MDSTATMSPTETPRSPSPLNTGDSVSDDEEILMLKLKQSEAEQARIRAEQEELRAKLALCELKRKKALKRQQTNSQTSTTPTKQAGSAFMSSDQSSPDFAPPTPTDLVVAKSATNRLTNSSAKLFSPELQKVHNDEIIKRRRLDCSPSIKNSLLPASIRATPPRAPRVPREGNTRSASNNEPEVLVPKSPSPIKPKKHGDVVLLRQRLGLDKGLSAHDLSLKGGHKKPKLAETVPKSSVVVGTSTTADGSGRSGMHVAPTMGLKSTQMARVERTRKDALDKRRGTVYAGMSKQPVDESALSTSIPFAERLKAARRGNAKKAPRDSSGQKSALQVTDSARQKMEDRKGQPDEEDLRGTSNKGTVSDSDSDDDLEIEPPLSSTDSSSAAAASVPTTSAEPTPSVVAIASKLSGTQTDLHDSYTNLALLTRYTSVRDMAATMRDKKIFTVSTLYGAVTPPEYDPPPYPDWAVFGVVARKSSIMYTKRHATVKKKAADKNTGAEQADKDAKDLNKIIASATVESGATGRRPKPPPNKESAKEEEDKVIQSRRYFILKLTDLKQDVDVFIMGPALDKFWKLRLGDVVALLNPGVWAAKSAGATGFNLNMTEHDDQVVEIGRARDFGICKAMTRKETPCRNWVDLHKTEYCEFHVELAVRRTSSRRAEVNKGTTMFSPKKNGHRMIMTRGGAREGLLPDPLAPRPDRANRTGAKIYCFERSEEDEDMNYGPGRHTFRGH
ncbi:hypothetical protein V1525DRAFT_432494 [Lipomyces kononenkoae]|uniref:Uncharacterized protein n=1 Tax=Lipomyces kononenkoae TaxID=34357 RepID=A0ACC3T2T4_LIPKO